MSKLIGYMRNNWRERHVRIYEIEGDPDNVKTIGKSFHEGIADVETIEPKEAFKRAIAMFPKTYVYE